jgi:TolA-binding protein
MILLKYYHNNKKYRQSVTAFKRYLLHYPRGRFSAEAEDKILYGEGMFSDSENDASDKSSRDILSFPEAMELYESGEFRKALKLFSKIQDSTSKDSIEAELRVGICLFRLGRSSDATVRLTDFIKKNGKSSFVPEALFYIGESYKSNRETDKAISFYKKALSMSKPSQQIYVLITETLQKLEGDKK